MAAIVCGIALLADLKHPYLAAGIPMVAVPSIEKYLNGKDLQKEDATSYYVIGAAWFFVLLIVNVFNLW
jgi:hypothetical protein